MIYWQQNVSFVNRSPRCASVLDYSSEWNSIPMKRKTAKSVESHHLQSRKSCVGNKMYLFQINSTGVLHCMIPAVDPGNAQFSAVYLEHDRTCQSATESTEKSPARTKCSSESYLQAVVHLKLCNERVWIKRNYRMHQKRENLAMQSLIALYIMRKDSYIELWINRSTEYNRRWKRSKIQHVCFQRIKIFKTMVFCNFVMKKSAKVPKCTQNETALQCLGSLISREE